MSPLIQPEDYDPDPKPEEAQIDREMKERIQRWAERLRRWSSWRPGPGSHAAWKAVWQTDKKPERKKKS